MWTVGKFNLFIHKHLYFNFLNCNIWFVKVFLPELRILGRIEEAMVVALPLSRDSSAVYVPLAANIKLQPTVNGDYISGITLKQYFWGIWREKNYWTKLVHYYQNWMPHHVMKLCFDERIIYKHDIHDKNAYNKGHRRDKRHDLAQGESLNWIYVWFPVKEKLARTLH